ncbi:hypothetical protein C483_02875 [Natrialba hulunbeirensis JCM 10989]|uniref:Uncharacterized protein n=1 Tax=Natrialba hulunbeirensis JCM 10989 TaxID=1227493 RepID=M0A7A8_9EURY|nr:hypothetical protein [Natrialba hulunbeirensis]ELY94640.1 hypothetical protein C483_02875 [Natrialba hulunbeirensis JCM 10989]
MHIPDDDYTLEEFCRVIIDSPESVLEGYHYNQIKSFFYLTEDGWRDYLNDYYETEDLGGITKISGEFVNRKGAEQPARFYIGEYEDNLQMVITAETEEAIRQVLLPTFDGSDHISPMPIMTEDFQRMNDMVLTRYEDMRISEFKSKRVPSLADARIRPDVDREIEYKGIDGRDRLDELRSEYGVVPTRIQYEHENVSMKIDTSGKFTLLTVNKDSFNILFDLVKEVVESVLELRDVARNIEFKKREVMPGNLKVQVPEVSSGEIRFDQQVTLMQAENLVHGAKNSENMNFSFTDVTKEAGSLDFSAQVADESRGSLFNVSATEESMRIVPKHNCSFPSLVEFYLAVIQLVDGGAKMHLYESQLAA